jgi:tetratricopeptide (TPR) repeat protein
MRWVEVPDGRGNLIHRPAKPYTDPLRDNWTHYLVAFQDPETGKLVSVAHQMIENIIAANQWRYPLVFANQVPGEVKYDLNKYSKRVGWLYQLTRQPHNGAFDVDTTMIFVKDIWEFRGLDDPEVYRGPVGTALVIGSLQSIIDFVHELEQQADTSKALEVDSICIDEVPEYWQSYIIKANLLGLDDAGKDSLVGEYLDYLDRLQEHNPHNVYYHIFRGMANQYIGDTEAALTAYWKAYAINRAMPITYHSLAAVLMGTGRTGEAVAISREFIKTNPGDATARAIISRGS